MARLALLNPKNFAPDTGGSKFKEGYVRVDQSYYTVFQDPPYPPDPQKPPYTAFMMEVTRLTDELEPLMDEDDNPVTEKLHFGLGGKSLPLIHPANGTGPDDDDPEDLGVELGVQGNTLKLINEDYKLNAKSGLAYLTSSLTKIGYTQEHLDRVWAPDFKGVVFHMKTQLSEDKSVGRDGVERPIPYKVADKFFAAKSAAAAGAGTSKKGPGKEKSGAAVNGSGKSVEAEKLLDPILMGLSEVLDGQTVTRKTLSTKVSSELQSKGVDTKSHIPILTLVKDNDWLAKNGGKYDFTLDVEAGTVTFGSPAAA